MCVVKGLRCFQLLGSGFGWFTMLVVDTGRRLGFRSGHKRLDINDLNVRVEEEFQRQRFRDLTSWAQ